MGRPLKMTDTQLAQDLVANVTYGPAGELLSMTGSSVGETRTYNSMGQLSTLTGLNGVSLQYNYPGAGANVGQIASQQDLASGETTTYQYDTLQRLTSATSTQGWGQSFGYDAARQFDCKIGLERNSSCRKLSGGCGHEPSIRCELRRQWQSIRGQRRHAAL